MITAKHDSTVEEQASEQAGRHAQLETQLAALDSQHTERAEQQKAELEQRKHTSNLPLLVISASLLRDCL